MQTSLIIEHEFDTETLNDIQTLREVRLGLVKKQIKQVEETVDELIRRGLVAKNDRKKHLQELHGLLTEKAEKLESRNDGESKIYFDEILLYSSMMTKID